MTASRVLLLVLALTGVAPAATAQSAGSPPPAADQGQWSVVLGGTATTLRGDCQEDCPAHGTGEYLHTASVIGLALSRVSPHIDAGLEVSWVPATLQTADYARSTFLMGAALYQPWPARGFFLKGAVGMVFVRNFQYSEDGRLPPVTSKGLGFSYSAGWEFRQRDRIGLQLFGAQHVAALGDFETSAGVINDVIGNYWSLGAAIVIR